MTHCNDQLIDQLLTQAEQEGRCPDFPSTAIRKALLRRTGGTVVSPMPGVVCAKTRWDELQPSATPLRDYPRPCDHPSRLDVLLVSAACLLGLEVSWRHLNVVHVCSSTKPARPGAHIQRHQIEPAGQYAEPAYRNTAHPNGHRLPAKLVLPTACPLPIRRSQSSALRRNS